MSVRSFVFPLSVFLVCGCVDINQPDPAPQQQTSQAPTEPGTESQAPSSHEQAPSAPPRPTIAKEDGRLVDLQAEQAKNPELVIIDNKINASDPISAIGSAYVTQTSRVQALNMQHQLKLMQAEKGRPLNFNEFKDLVKQLNIQFNKLPPYRMFGYDSKTGEIAIIEDKAMKKKIYDEKGIPWDE
ncbi:hypothetical protein [Thalassoroseus pseudoceratinae]|uniref:hypothetical protein n=1 Tax=Thalassoroseus pseudoceratinae TaxID=2713176 RepID=UPI00142481D8|nr:hypothetical protein [Thalassoroseus pseudoceratinae]